ELFVPEELIGAKMRSTPIAMKARVSSGVDWLNVNISWAADGISVDREEIQRCLREGKKYVRLSDNSYASLDATRVQALIDQIGELFVPEELIGAKMRSTPIAMKARVSSGVDWLNVNISWAADGISVDREEIQRCLREGKKYVRLSDNSYASLDATRVQALID